LPSIAGKTIGTNSFLFAQYYTAGSVATSTVVDFWGWQVEAGSTATDFQTATGTIQGELAACQRYYWRAGSRQTTEVVATGGRVYSSTIPIFVTPLPVQMRVSPSATATGTFAVNYASTAVNTTTFNADVQSPTMSQWYLTTSSVLTQGQAVGVNTTNTSTYIEFSAEL